MLALRFKRSLAWQIIVVFFILIPFIGLRDGVGGDWEIYSMNFDMISEASASEILGRDPAYNLISVISDKIGSGVYGVNFACASIFCLCLYRFCSSLPRPFLGITAALPYLIIVVSMGYTRQSVSIGLLMALIIELSKNRLLAGFILFVLMCSFQQTSIVASFVWLPVVMKSRSHIARFLSAVLVCATVYGLFCIFLSSRLSIFIDGYIVSQQMSSSGALPRILVLVGCSLIYTVWLRKRFRGDDLILASEPLAVASFISLALLFVIPSSTVVDRASLYLLPVVPLVTSYSPDLFAPGRQRTVAILALLAINAVLLSVWLHFGAFSYAWIPYNNILLK